MYEFTDDIYEVIEDKAGRYSAYEIEDLCFMAGSIIVDENGEDYYSCDLEDAMREESANIIHLWSISTKSKLFKYLTKWYHGKEKILHNVRNAFYRHNDLYFVTGCGYAIFDADLLGGNGNGNTEKEFRKFIKDSEAWEEDWNKSVYGGEN